MSQLESEAMEKRARRPLLWLVAFLVGTGVASLLWFVLSGPDSRLDEARRTILDDERFSTPKIAAESFADVADLLFQEAKSCASSSSNQDPQCEATFSGAAYANVSALSLLDCTLPELHQVRERMLKYLAELERFSAHRDGVEQAPVLPPVPMCEGISSGR